MNALFHALLAQESYLKAGFENAIRIAMHEAKRRSTKPSPEEPDVVAMLVLEGVPYIAKTLQAVVAAHGIRSTVSSVFCHQKPTVEFNHKRDCCELGDILLVHRHTDRQGGKVMHSNALLLQAKMLSGSTYAIPKKEQHQLRLYENWPRFRYVRSGPRLKGQMRDVKPKVRHSGAQYLLIDDGAFGPARGGLLGLPGTFCMAVWPAVPVLYAHHSLADELLRFMVGMSGRQFIDNLGGDPSAWSTVVWDLLEHSAYFLFNRKNVKVNSASRLGGDSMSSSISGMNFCFLDDRMSTDAPARHQGDSIATRIFGLRGEQVPPIFRDPPDQSTDDMGGVSVILIETSGHDEGVG